MFQLNDENEIRQCIREGQARIELGKTQVGEIVVIWTPEFVYGGTGVNLTIFRWEMLFLSLGLTFSHFLQNIPVLCNF